MAEVLRKNLRRAVTVIRRELIYFLPRPLEINLEVTHRCNLRCKMCGVWGKPRLRKAPELTLEEIGDLFAQMQRSKIGLVTLAGGEPLLRPDIFEIIAAAKRNGLRCHMFTNATRLDACAIERLLRSRLDKLIVSLDGLEPVHDAIRGVPGAFASAHEALAALAAARDSGRSGRLEIDVHMTLLPDNVADLPRLHALCEALGVNFSFQPYSEATGASVEQTRRDGPAIGSIRYLPHGESLRFTAAQARQIQVSLSRLPATFYTKLLASLSPEALQQGVIPIARCYVVRTLMMIDPYGNIYPCTNLDDYSVGSIREQPLPVIWQGPKYVALRRRLSRGLLPICAHCCHCADNLTTGQLAAIVLRGKWRARGDRGTARRPRGAPPPEIA